MNCTKVKYTNKEWAWATAVNESGSNGLVVAYKCRLGAHYHIGHPKIPRSTECCTCTEPEEWHQFYAYCPSIIEEKASSQSARRFSF